MANTLVFVDLPTPDIEATSAFYKDLFGWTVNGRPQGVFHQVVPGQGLHLGLWSEREQVPDPSPRTRQPRSGVQPRTYILVDSPPRDYLNKAVILGAIALWEQTYWEEFDGYHASFLDPWGNQLVMWWRPADS
jgi:predicted enzyme related to lactoylglutathione lyase